jgi:hypothetical protein
MKERVAEGDLAPHQVRRAIELIEQAPAEALYVKLLESLGKAGAEADLRNAGEVSRRIAFAYKLTVELGAKLDLVSEEDLGWRRRLAAMLFGEEESGDVPGAGEDPGPDQPLIWTPPQG